MPLALTDAQLATITGAPRLYCRLASMRARRDLVYEMRIAFRRVSDPNH
jgi:hypothetical protein